MSDESTNIIRNDACEAPREGEPGVPTAPVDGLPVKSDSSDMQPRVPPASAEAKAEAPSAALLPGGVAPLWKIKELCVFLGRKRRWAEYAIKIPDTQVGSVPHVRVGRSPRFDPETIREWALAGCPPAADFAAWNRKKMKHGA